MLKGELAREGGRTDKEGEEKARPTLYHVELQEEDRSHCW